MSGSSDRVSTWHRKRPLSCGSVRPSSRFYRWIVYGYSLLAISLTAGVVYGFPALRQQLLQHDDSTLNESALGAAYTAGAWSTQGCRFLTGLARDQWGCRVVCCFSMLAVAAGFVGLAWSDTDSAVSLGCSLFIVGLGAGAQLCLQPVASLFPQSAGSVLASLSGAFQVSGLVFLALTKASTNRAASFSGFAGVVLVLVLSGLVLLPNTPTFQSPPETLTNQLDTLSTESKKEGERAKEIQDRDESASCLETIPSSGMLLSTSERIQDEKSVLTDQEEQLDLTKREKRETTVGADIEDKKKDRDSNPKSMRRQVSSAALHDSHMNMTKTRQIVSLEYCLLLVWFSLTVTPMQYYIGSLGFQLEEQGDDSGFYTDLFSIIYASSSALSPAGGFLADQCGIGVAQGLATLLAATSFFVLSAANVTTLNFQVLGLTCNAVGRMLIYGFYFAHVGKRFGYQNYGTLAGLGLLISAVASLLQYPLIAAAANGHAQAVNLASGSTLLATLPYCLWLARKEQREKQVFDEQAENE